MLIDTHFHLDLMENMSSLIREMPNADIGIMAIETTPKAYEQEKCFCDGIDNIKVCLGMHPQLIGERSHEINLFLSKIRECKYIGEVGLDFSAGYNTTQSQQLLCFRKIVKACANMGGKVLSIHSVKAAGTVINELEEAGTFDSCICILHWFTGTELERRKAIEVGAYFSINPRMLKTRSGQETIKGIPAERILLETDAPFTMKIPSIKTLSSELKRLVEDISSIRGRNMLKQITETSSWIVNEE